MTTDGLGAKLDYFIKAHEAATKRLRAFLQLLDAGYTEAQIAQEWGITQQRVHQLKQKALRLREQEANGGEK